MPNLGLTEAEEWGGGGGGGKKLLYSFDLRWNAAFPVNDTIISKNKIKF